MINKILGLLGLATKAGAVVAGTDVCKEAIKKEKIKLLIIAEDASQKTKENFKYICSKQKIPIFVLGKIEQLSKAIGNNNKAIIGIKSISFSEEIYKILNGGEIIG